MIPKPSNDEHSPKESSPPSMALLALALVVGWAGGPFLAAGTLTWPVCWGYFVVLGLGLTSHQIYVRRRNPDLAKHRKRIGADTKRWDVVWNLLFWPLMIAMLIVAGMGVRFGWPLMPIGFWLVGIALFAAAMGLSAWAMATNPHFEGTVRIQHDRGHTVIEHGPYRFVRHPGYVGLCLWALATPFLLVSWPALLPAWVVVIWLVVRTYLEDLVLQRELDGYSNYAQRVRFRLVPGVW